MTDAPLPAWVAEVSAELGIDLDVDIGLLLRVARDAAHDVARPAAPLTTFLVGYAAATAGGGPDAVRRAAEVAFRLAAQHAAGNSGAGADPAP